MLFALYVKIRDISNARVNATQAYSSVMNSMQCLTSAKEWSLAEKSGMIAYFF